MQCNSRHKRHCVYFLVRCVFSRRLKSDETRRGSHLAGYCHGKRPAGTIRHIPYYMTLTLTRIEGKSTYQ